jgi:hypothetical protein
MTVPKGVIRDLVVEGMENKFRECVTETIVALVDSGLLRTIDMEVVEEIKASLEARFTPSAANKAAEEGELPVLAWEDRTSNYQTEVFANIERMQAEIDEWRDYYSSARSDALLAVEEGGLPALPEEIEVGGEGWDFEDFKSQKTFSVDHMHEYALKAIASDRAARPVANKADVEPTLWVQYIDGEKTQNVARDAKEKAMVESIHRTMAPGTKMEWQSLYATPPATTGASTARDQALEEAATVCDKKYEARAASGHPREASAARNCAAEIRALKGSVGASTVLTDERISAMAAEIEEKDDLIARLRRQVDAAVERGFDVFGAAQAGQVAVPIYQIQYEAERGSSIWHDATEEAYHTFVLPRRRIVYAAPSPAKESK